MRSLQFLQVLQALNKHRFGRRPLDTMIRRATELVEEGRVEPDSNFGHFYEEVWEPLGVPTRVWDTLTDQFPTCPECRREPVLLPDEYEGYWRNSAAYCSAKCRRAAHDDEDSRQCDCGAWYDSNEGHYFYDSDYCSDECAFDALRYGHEFREFTKQHPEYDERELLDKIHELEWYRIGSSRELYDIFREAAKQILKCEICDASIADDEGHHITDLDDGWFCTDDHTWDAIAQYLEVETGKSWSAYQAQQLLKGYALWELEDAGRLEAAVRKALR